MKRSLEQRLKDAIQGGVLESRLGTSAEPFLQRRSGDAAARKLDGRVLRGLARVLASQPRVAGFLSYRPELLERIADADASTLDTRASELDDSDDETHVDMSQSRIRAATTATLGSVGGWDDTRFNRQLDPRAVFSTRCRTFHSKLSEAALEFMNNQINEWLDGHDEITIKFATSTIGLFEGKHTEPNLIMTLFY